MSSLGDIQQVYTLLQQIEEMLGRIDTKSDEADKKLNKIVTNNVVVRRTLTRTLSLVMQLSGDEDLNNYIAIVQRAIMLTQQLIIINNLLMATNPWMFALGVVGSAGVAIGAVDMFGSYQ